MALWTRLLLVWLELLSVASSPVNSAGFKNEGQFVATLEAAKNLNLPFADLKDRVTAGQSLGEAIHALRPNLTEDASHSAAIQAEEQAKVVRSGDPESSKP